MATAATVSLGGVGFTPAPAIATTPALLTAPLSSSLDTAAGAWAFVPMGHLGDPLNRFWQAFFRSSSTNRWTLVTPPGVASNGGLVGSPVGAGFTAGFQPSQSLRSSPLATTTTDGRTWSPGLVPDSLMYVPDALASSPGGGTEALVRTRGGSVLASTADPLSWRTVVTRAGLAATPGGRTCRVGALTAIATPASGQALVGTSCGRGGKAGIFSVVPGHGPAWPAPGLPAAASEGGSSVLRLVWDGSAFSALVALRSSSAGLVATSSADDGARWRVSAKLGVGPSEVVASTAAVGSGFVVLLRSSAGTTAAWRLLTPGEPWQRLPAPPPGTQTLAGSADATTGLPAGTVDALAVDHSVLTDWQLVPAAVKWVPVQRIDVPIQYGSSS